MSSIYRSGAAHLLRILIEEPHTDTRQALARYLTMDGHFVAGVGTRGEALEWLSQNHCDLIFVTIGIDGTEWTLLREAQLPPTAYGVAMSTGAIDLELIERPEFGFRDHLLKPFSPCEVDGIVAGAIREREAALPAVVEIAATDRLVA